MRILVACEESQAVTKEFRKLGHEAYSCDVLECSGGHPEWHLQQDVTELLKEKWDMIIAFPPCTFLTVAGNRWFNVEKYGEKARKRIADRKEAIDFFMMFVNADCERIAIENPVGIMSSEYRKPNQVIHPYMFGDKARKGTCLWLKGLPNLTPTNIVDMGEIKSGGYSVGASADCARDENGKIIAWNDPRTARIRSKTFPGIAEAMAGQWGKL
jgi:site-specific DNA-cytosine methylase